MDAWRIPLSDVDLGAAEEAAVLRVVRSRWLTVGAEVAAFERELAAHCGVEDAVAVSSCTAALHLACAALGVGPGVEVIVPTMTFVATANAVVHAGGRPVFADSIGDGDFSIDPLDVERRITPATRGVICMHYGGSPCAMAELQALCGRHGLFLIEDAAHAVGARWRGTALGALGDVGCFSFFGNKNLTTGEGGMVLARAPEALERVRLLRSHGMTSTSWDRFQGHAFDYDVVEPGFNYRPTELAAAVGRAQLERLAANNRRRAERLTRYSERVAELPGLRMARSVPDGACHLAVVLTEGPARQQALRAALAEARIQSSLHYPPVHLFRQFRERDGHRPGHLPVAEDLARRAVTLPLYPAITPAQVDEVCDVLAAAAQAAAGTTAPAPAVVTRSSAEP